MKLYASNLASTTTETMLKDAFAVHGTVEECRIPTKKNAKTGNAIGFVTMPVEAEAKAAIGALNDSELSGTKISVKESKQQRRDSQTGNGKS